MTKRTLVLIGMFLFVFSGAALAVDEKPIQLARVEDVQLVPKEESIKGLRLSIYGVNEDMTGLSLGFIHKSTGNVKGIELGLVGISEGDFFGFQHSLVWPRYFLLLKVRYTLPVIRQVGETPVGDTGASSRGACDR